MRRGRNNRGTNQKRGVKGKKGTQRAGGRVGKMTKKQYEQKKPQEDSEFNSEDDDSDNDSNQIAQDIDLNERMPPRSLTDHNPQSASNITRWNFKESCFKIDQSVD